MTALPIPASIAESPAASQPLLQAVEKQFGLVPNAFRLIGTSPASLEGFLALSGALGKGQLDPATRGRLALAVAESNGCDYCLSAHTYIGKNLIKLSEAEIRQSRRRIDRPESCRGSALRQRGRPDTRTRRGRRPQGRQGRRLQRRADHRDRNACRAEHVDQLCQCRRKGRDRLPGRDFQGRRIRMAAAHPSCGCAVSSRGPGG
jgi:AhpD family alkylhydroperoxidase